MNRRWNLQLCKLNSNPNSLEYSYLNFSSFLLNPFLLKLSFRIWICFVQINYWTVSQTSIPLFTTWNILRMFYIVLFFYLNCNYSFYNYVLNYFKQKFFHRRLTTFSWLVKVRKNAVHPSTMTWHFSDFIKRINANQTDLR